MAKSLVSCFLTHGVDAYSLWLASYLFRPGVFICIIIRHWTSFVFVAQGRRVVFFVIILYLMLTRIFTPTVYPALKQTEVKQIG